MKILMITHILPFPPHGGCRIRNFNLIKQAASKHELHLVTFYRKAHSKTEQKVAEATAEIKKFCKEVHVYPIEAEHNKFKYYSTLLFNLFSGDPYSAAIYHSKSMINKVKEMIDRYKYDVVEIGEIGMLNYARLVPGIPKLLVHHNVESQLLARRATVANPLAKWYLNLQAKRTERFEKEAGNLIERHTACSSIDMETLKKINPDINCVVVPNGVDTDYFRPTDDKMIPNSLIFVGGLQWLPNRDAMNFFIDKVWADLKQRVPDFTLSVVGKDAPQELVAFAAKEPDFHVTGFIEDIRPIITQSAVFIVPIRVGGGTRLKVLDGLAMGKAIVSHTIGCEGIDVTHDHDIIIADSAEDTVEAIVGLLSDEAKLKRIATNARQTAEQKYDWNIIGPILMDVYEELKALK